MSTGTRPFLLPLLMLLLAACAPPPGPILPGLPVGNLQVNLNGLPPETPAQITVTGPNSVNRVVTNNSTALFILSPETYNVVADDVTVGDTVYRTANPTRTIDIRAGQATEETFVYSPDDE